MCNVPNAFVCIEVKVIIRILSFTRFFKLTAIILNTTVYMNDISGVLTFTIAGRIFMAEIQSFTQSV